MGDGTERTPVAPAPDPSPFLASAPPVYILMILLILLMCGRTSGNDSIYRTSRADPEAAIRPTAAIACRELAQTSDCMRRRKWCPCVRGLLRVERHAGKETAP